MSCSTTFSQNGSYSFSAIERDTPPGPGTGAGRISTDLGAARCDPFELLDRLVDDRQGDHRGGEDPVLVVELPRLVHPLVERMDHRVGRVDVVLQPLLEQAGEGREHQASLELLLVHQLETCRGGAERLG